jgi:hypothetical protein
LGRTKYCNRSPLDAFFFEAKGTKKKAWQKRNAVSVGLCAPHPQELFEKSSTKNFNGGCSSL